jgi:hypothetical protein
LDRDWPRLTSIGQAEFLIRKAYEHCGFELASGHTPGAMVRREYVGHNLSGNPYGALFHIIDEMTALVRFLSVGFMVAAPEDSEGAGFFWKMSAKAVSNLATIRVLSFLGLDGNARMVLRHHYETMLLWSRGRVDDAARIDFTRVSDPSESNEYWHKYLARSKSERFIRRALGSKADT